MRLFWRDGLMAFDVATLFERVRFARFHASYLYCGWDHGSHSDMDTEWDNGIHRPKHAHGKERVYK